MGRHTGRKLVGVWKLDAQKLNTEKTADVVKITMHSECRVSGRLTCNDLTKGIHVDLGEDEDEPVNTVAKLDDRLMKIRKELWGDRDLPFLVAIIAGKGTPYHTSLARKKASCQLVADYGVTAYPTMILIDRRGNVVGKFFPHRPDHITRLEKLLEAN